MTSFESYEGLKPVFSSEFLTQAVLRYMLTEPPRGLDSFARG